MATDRLTLIALLQGMQAEFVEFFVKTPEGLSDLELADAQTVNHCLIFRESDEHAEEGWVYCMRQALDVEYRAKWALLGTARWEYTSSYKDAAGALAAYERIVPNSAKRVMPYRIECRRGGGDWKELTHVG